MALVVAKMGRNYSGRGRRGAGRAPGEWKRTNFVCSVVDVNPCLESRRRVAVVVESD